MLVTDFVLIQDTPLFAADPGPVSIRLDLAYINEAVGDLFQEYVQTAMRALARISERAVAARRRCCADPA